jgi:uncharacterized protein (TIGR00730 family)
MKKAYNNSDFLNSPSARLIRILSELEEPKQRFRKHGVDGTVVFFGSSRISPQKTAAAAFKQIDARIKKAETFSKKLEAEFEKAEKALIMSRYYEDAALIAESLTLWFQELRKKGKNLMVCSGGGPGIMDAANCGAKRAGGKSIGLNISLPFEQFPNKHQSEELAFEFHYFFIRKFWFVYLAKAMIVFPGGFGTMDELFEVLTLIQTKKTKKTMPVVLYGSEYWNEIINFKALRSWDVIDPADLDLFETIDNPNSAVQYLKKEMSGQYGL